MRRARNEGGAEAPGRRAATGTGFVAILLWSLLALFTVWTAPVPPFLLTALAFAIGGAVGLVWTVVAGQVRDLARVPMRVYLFGTAGLFGYHFLYFSALRSAPPAEAGLIAYLWPLLIVLLSGLLPGETLRPGHVLGAAVSFLGAGLIVASGGAGFSPDNLVGYGLALMCAFVWSIYSVASRGLGKVPTASVTVFCLATALLSGLAHLALEETLWPAGAAGWCAVLALGLGPVGLAFFVWDVGVKHGDIQLLGVASYAAPLLSTLALVLSGAAVATGTLALAAVLIVGGAALAAWSSARGART